MFDIATHTANHAPHIAVLIVFVLVFGPPALIAFLTRREWMHRDDVVTDDHDDALHTYTFDNDGEMVTIEALDMFDAFDRAVALNIHPSETFVGVTQ